jgi:hypothetical protein
MQQQKYSKELSRLVQGTPQSGCSYRERIILGDAQPFGYFLKCQVQIETL